ncbi:MAG: hypothetical protein R3A48_11425 [Polyangiales bacterium]
MSGAVTVAAIMDATPTLDVNTGRIRNAQSVRWIWSSAEPGGPVMDGTVPLRYGRAGVDRNGVPGPAYGGDTLPRGLYYWFVFATVRGQVVASSVAQSFRVGLPVPDLRRCATVSDCVESASDVLLYDCLNATCRRRCASEVDCETGTAPLEAPPLGEGGAGPTASSPRPRPPTPGSPAGATERPGARARQAVAPRAKWCTVRAWIGARRRPSRRMRSREAPAC